jgi:hypothetical protein
MAIDDDYSGAPVVAGEGLLQMPGFWAAYFQVVEGQWGDEDELTTAEWFGVSQEELAEAYAALYGESQWPAIKIPFSDGHVAVVLECNLPEDSGTEYYVEHPDWGRQGFLATISGHGAGPGLAWRELMHIVRATAADDMAGVRDPHQRLLLLLPALGDAACPGDAADLVADALMSIGLPADRAAHGASLLLSSWANDNAQWTYAPHRPDDGDEVFAGILECNLSSSPRHGIRLAQGITREQSDRLARALGTWTQITGAKA